MKNALENVGNFFFSLFLIWLVLTLIISLVAFGLATAEEIFTPSQVAAGREIAPFKVDVNHNYVFDGDSPISVWLRDNYEFSLFSPDTGEKIDSQRQAGEWVIETTIQPGNWQISGSIIELKASSSTVFVVYQSDTIPFWTRVWSSTKIIAITAFAGSLLLCIWLCFQK